MSTEVLFLKNIYRYLTKVSRPNTVHLNSTTYTSTRALPICTTAPRVKGYVKIITLTPALVCGGHPSLFLIKNLDIYKWPFFVPISYGSYSTILHNPYRVKVSYHHTVAIIIH